MKTSTRLLGLFLLMLAGCRSTEMPAKAQNGAAGEPTETALDRYLAKAEPAYKWEEVKDGEFAGGKNEVNLRLTSQTWQSKPWQHRLQMIVPEQHEDTPVLNDA